MQNIPSTSRHRLNDAALTQELSVKMTDDTSVASRRCHAHGRAHAISDDDHGHARRGDSVRSTGASGRYALVGGFAALVVLAFFMLAVGGIPS